MVRTFFYRGFADWSGFRGLNRGLTDLNGFRGLDGWMVFEHRRFPLRLNFSLRLCVKQNLH